jgi:hypothetical protein
MVCLTSSSAGAIGWASVRADRPPCIDGRLDDPVWKIAAPATGFLDFLPEPGRKPSQETEVRIAWDDEGLYLAFRCHDTHPEQIRCRLAKRDAAFDDDWIGVILDPMAQGRSAVELMVNPRGCPMDALLSAGSGGDDVGVDYDFDAAAVRDSAGWSAELSVPWSSLGGAVSRRVGFFALRQIRRTGERASWPPIETGNQNWLAAGASLDLAPEIAGARAELLPVLTLHRCETRDDRGGWRPGRARPAAGFTARAAVSSGVALAVTLRPDFSHVEADAPQVSLNRRFPIVYAEKRAFFLEDRDLFDVAAEGGELAAVFHSRAIVVPVAGARLAGQIGGANRLGLLWVRDGAEGERPHSALWVRGRSYLSGASFVGFYAGMRHDGAADSRLAGTAGAGRTAGVTGLDADLVLARGVRVAAHLLRNVGTGRAGGHATALHVDWCGAWRGLNLVYQEVAPDFVVPTGVLRRCDVREASLEGRRHFCPRLPGCTRLTAWISATAAGACTGAPTDRLARFGIRLETAGPGAVTFARTLGAEWCAGRRFDAGAWQATAESAPRSWLRLTLGGAFAGTPIYATIPAQGRSRTVSAGLTLRPSAWLSASIEATQVRLWRAPRVPLSEADARRGRLEVQPHRHFRLRATVDAGGGPGRWVTDFLAELRIAPETTLQLGWGNAYEPGGTPDGSDRAREVTRVAFLKAAYGLRF